MTEDDINLFDGNEDIVVETEYTEDDIRTLDWKEHIRRRPGMYIGKLGDVVSKMNTGGKYDSKAFKKSVGLNGVGLKAVNALSTEFIATSYRDGMMKCVRFVCGELVEEFELEPTDEPNGTCVSFTPDRTIFRDYRFLDEFITPLVKNYTFLNTGLAIVFNGRRLISRNGLLDLLQTALTSEPLYPIIHLKGDDIEIALTHVNQYGEEYYSFVNGQHTTQGGTHLTAFKEAVSRTMKDYFGRNFEYSDIRNGMVAAIALKVEEPIFESQTKNRLGSRDMGPEGPTVAKFIGDFVKKELDDYLHRDLEVAKVILKKVQDSERSRKAMAGIAKLAREKSKKVNLHNKKLLDCRVHLNDVKGDEDLKLASSIFITEGDSAAGSITKIRNVDTQAVFSLRGKPLNTFGLTQKVVYENDEFNCLQAALNIEGGIDELRYNNVIIATDADVDGMHIRLLLITFFLQFFPDLIKKGHVYVLQTPLFRVRNKKTARRGSKKAGDETYYCYNDDERVTAINKLGENAEITRFKGLGEISPEEFKDFIGEDMRLDRVTLKKEDGVAGLLEFYMGKNTMERQRFIIDNLIIEDDSQIS